MYEQIRGRVVRKDAARLEVVLETAGVGWLLRVTRPTLEATPPVDAEGRLLVHLLVRENALTLFGFAREAERAVFRLLLEATGVGPQTAGALLNARAPEELLRALRDEDPAALTGIRGVGEKTAKRLALELRRPAAELLLELQLGPSAAGAAPAGAAGPAGGSREDALKALVALEWTRAEAERAVAAALRGAPAGIEAGELVRRALASRSAPGTVLATVEEPPTARPAAEPPAGSPLAAAGAGLRKRRRRP